jgi:indolepyruvate ferredoxin oxidoreductase
LYLTYLITTNQADGGGTVKVAPHPEIPISKLHPATLSSENIVISDMVLIPPHTSMREATLSDRHARFLVKARTYGLNRHIGPRRVRLPVGFVTSGLPSCYLEEVLKMIGLGGRTPILKLGVTYPIDPDDILDIAKHVEHLVIVEEKRGFLEEQVAGILTSLHQEGRLAKVPALWGKKFPNGEPGFPSTRGLNTSVILEVLGPAFLNWKEYFPTLQVELIKKELDEILHTRSQSFEVPLRTPTFCPGCPHRDSAVVSLKLKKDPARKADLVFHGESGCHSMLQFAPNEGLMQNYSGMGLGGGTGAGMAPFVTNSQVVFLGDSTFFHSGMVAISDSIKNNQNITYVILQNDTTAMTGHQPTPGNNVDVMGNPTLAQNIERVLRGLYPGELAIHSIDPSDRAMYEQLLNETLKKPGVKVIIADKECAITKHRRLNADKKRIRRELGFIPKEEKINITPDVCEYCLECTRQTGCPGLTVEETLLGRKIVTDLSACVDDGACARTKACPSFEKVTIERSNPMNSMEALPLDWKDTAEPRIESFHGRWSAYTAAVGGMGAGVVNAVLVRAGMKAGYDVCFLDKKGLAIRNGGVYGHVVFSKEGPVGSPVIPYGKADLLIGLDLLEAARGQDARINLRVAHAGRTRAVINNHKQETVLSLMGRQDFDADKLEDAIQAKARLGGYISADFARLSEEHLGTKLFANMMVLGAAYQRGWIPLKEKEIFSAISESVRQSDVDANYKAFQLGRYYAARPDRLKPAGSTLRAEEIIQVKAAHLRKRYAFLGPSLALRYIEMAEQACRWLDFTSEQKIFVVNILYDLVRYQNVAYARKYLSILWDAHRKDQKRFNYRVSDAVMKNLYKVMAIKDEVWVAELLTSPEKYERDRLRYRIDPKRGDKISYRHLNRPRFTILGFNIEFDIETQDWMLVAMRSLKFLRALLPQWHSKERAFQAWYEGLVKGFNLFDSADDYEAYLKALLTPAQVRGYREIRYPLMEQARRTADDCLIQIRTKIYSSNVDVGVKPQS